MKKKISLICSAVCALSVVPFAVNAEEEGKIYGTMNIPYADFYAAEIENAYAVDAVSSATASKWSMNEPGQLVSGTYNDGNGTILGVKYPVEIKAADADKLKDTYGFVQTEEKPTAYKEVTVSGDTITVSKVIDTNGEQTVEGSAEVSTSTRYGDYQLNVKGYPEDTDLLGVIVNTTTGEKYALRHLENIWRAGQVSWSTGITTVEGHGNTLKYDNYVSSMGKTVNSVTFITLDGYTTVNVGSQYLPVKFAGEVKAEDSAAGAGKTSLALTGFPEDYSKTFSADDGFTVTESEISYTNAKPGTYTVKVSDSSGKYAELSGRFTLTSADIPVKYDNGKLVKADGAADDDYANYIKNLSSVDVNGTTYSASGKRGVKIIGEDGTVDLNASSKNTNVFDGSGNYTVTVNSTGYTSPYTFEIKKEEETTTAADTTTTAATTTTASSNKNNNSNSNSSSSSKTDSPKTGVNGVAVPMTFLVLAGAGAYALRKKND